MVALALRSGRGESVLEATTTEQIAASAVAEGRAAVGEACERAAGALGGRLGLLLAFASGELDHEAAASAIEGAAAGAPAAGMTGDGLISAKGPIEQGCVAMAFGPGVRAAVGASSEAGRDLRRAGRASVERALGDLGEQADLVLLLIDSSRGDIADTIAGAYEAAGPAIPLAGGAAGGADQRHFHAGRASADCVVAVAVAAAGPVGIASDQACTTRGAPSIVTASSGQRLQQIDGRPAEEVYLEKLGFTGVALDDDAFEALAITHPLAQPELHGEVRLRHVLDRGGDGAILTGTHIPANAAIEFTELEPEQLLRSGAQSVRDAAAGLGEQGAKAALVFDCAGRRRALRAGLDREVAGIAAALGDSPTPLAGLYTHGEIARLRGAKGDRNHAVVTVAFG